MIKYEEVIDQALCNKFKLPLSGYGLGSWLSPTMIARIIQLPHITQRETRTIAKILRKYGAYEKRGSSSLLFYVRKN